jgi:RNA polymerase sigma-70 factor (ECF subfamily)
MYRYAYRLTGNVADAEDIAQQAFLLAQRRLHQLREPDRARAWLASIVRNTYFKQSRRQRPLCASSAEVEVDWFADSRPHADPEDAAAVQTAINQLDANHKQVLLMYYFEQLSYRQIADAIQVKIGTVMSRLSRAKAHLREIIASGPSFGEIEL